MKSKLIKIIISLSIFLIAIIGNFDNIIINKVLYIISYLIVGYDVIKEAFENIFEGKLFDENFLMTIATIGAFLISEYPEAVCVMLLYQVGELFQEYASEKSKKSITSLMNIRPDYANLYKNKKIIKVNPEKVSINDLIIVSPGEKIPLDGIVVEGTTLLNTSALTGETLPRKVTKNDKVLSGSINIDGVIKIKVTSLYKNSTVNKILELVENVSEKKAKSENFITKFAKIYTPIVVLIAVFLVVFMPFVTSISFKVWLYRALSFLVVSCPCALVISIPLSFFASIGGASRNGILIKGSNAIEKMNKVNTIVFDKTGTLTEGVLSIQKIKGIGISKNELLKIVAMSEYYSNHPIALAIKNEYKEDIDSRNIKNVKEITGMGIKCQIDNLNVLVGNEKLMKKYGIEITKCKEDGTIIYVALDKKYSGYIVINDKIKGNAKNTIINLKRLGIKRMVMLTGDLNDTGRRVSKYLNINEAYTELLPNDKVNILSNIRNANNGKVAFVGDGINDAPVLCLADVGISMGGIGSDSAIEASDIVIMNDNISKIVDLLKLSNKTMKIVYENIIFAILIKIIVLLLSLFGISHMWEAVFADVGVTILTTINALRLLFVKFK